mmetsp:Transcript_76139/g.123701  ORF Transcript_76139/g.123701 Transcript_76139/m.123701 type:complete len:211 (+) Transcript_76139:112-744(+)
MKAISTCARAASFLQINPYGDPLKAGRLQHITAILLIVAHGIPLRVGALVVEEAHAVVAHDKIVLITRLRHFLVGNRAAGLHNVLDTELYARVDVIAEREEGVGRNRDARQIAHVLVEIRLCERLGLLEKLLRPRIHLDGCHLIHSLNIPHTRVDAFLPLGFGLELEAKHFRVLAHPPCCHLFTCELHAVHTRLLPRTYTHHHAIDGIAN